MPFFGNKRPEAQNNHLASLCSLRKVKRGSSSCLELLGNTSVENKFVQSSHSPPHKAECSVCLCSGHQHPSFDPGPYSNGSCVLRSFQSFVGRIGSRYYNSWLFFFWAIFKLLSLSSSKSQMIYSYLLHQNLSNHYSLLWSLAWTMTALSVVT